MLTPHTHQYLHPIPAGNSTDPIELHLTHLGERIGGRRWLIWSLAPTAVIFTLLMEQDAVQIYPWQMAFKKVYISK